MQQGRASGAAVPEVIVLDGHDAAGKSTLARMLAARLDGRHVKPFDGTLGDMIAWLWGHSDFELADRVSRAAVAKVLDIHRDARLLVFDRHWLTMFSVLPERYYASWQPLPATVLCWADTGTTVRRLAARGEPVDRLDVHAHYTCLYRALAERFGVPIIDTSIGGQSAALQKLASYFSSAGALGSGGPDTGGGNSGISACQGKDPPHGSGVTA